MVSLGMLNLSEIFGETISFLSFCGSSLVLPMIATYLEHLHGWGLCMHHS